MSKATEYFEFLTVLGIPRDEAIQRATVLFFGKSETPQLKRLVAVEQRQRAGAQKYLSVTALGKKLGGLDPEHVNKILELAQMQKGHPNNPKRWIATDEGVKYSKKGIPVLWKPFVLTLDEVKAAIELYRKEHGL